MDPVVYAIRKSMPLAVLLAVIVVYGGYLIGASTGIQVLGLIVGMFLMGRPVDRWLGEGRRQSRLFESPR